MTDDLELTGYIQWNVLILPYRVSKMKCLDFGDVLKYTNGFLQVLRVSCILQEFKFSPKFVGYPTGHRWGAIVVSHKDGVS
jgi:hypothetical protein